MKNKIINLLIIMALCVSVICLRPMYGVFNSIYIVFFTGCLVFFIKGFIQFVLKKQGGLIAYVSMLYNNLKEFINTQAREYNTIAWYNKPKYWLLFILLIIHVATKFYYGHPSIINILFQCAYATPILLFIFIGRAFPFAILLLIYGLYYLMGTTIQLSWIHNIHGILITVCWLWFLISIMGLMTTCWLIEIKRKKHTLWKRFLQGLGMCVLCISYWLGVFYVQDKVENYIAEKTFIADCIKHNKQAYIDDDDLEKYCSEMLKKWQNQLKQLRNK